nr:hypothetical protein [uncultured Draconibacterium sp.]
MKTEEVKVTEEKIEKPKPQKFYQLFYKYTDYWQWYPFSGPRDDINAKSDLEQTITNWKGADQEFKLISYEI